MTVVVVTITAVYGYEVWQRRWLCDDAMIAVRTVRQLLAGNGPVFNVGERAETDTSTVWTYLVAAASWLTRAQDPGHVAVLLGFGLSMVGLAVGLLGTARWLRAAGVDRPLLPAGALVVLALPPFWDFGTSGLETPLVFCWLALCWYLLCGIDEATRFRRLAIAAFVFGLGWLVRPDMALVSVCFLPALWLLARPSAWRTVGLAAVAGALPLGYEIFRAGYYGILVPLPAVSKNAASTDLARGIAYLRDFNGPYHLYVALLLLLAAGIVVATRRVPMNRAIVIPLSAAVLAGLALIGYVVLIGGDFMHGRMLLPGVLLLLLPVALLPAGATVGVLCAALAVWTVFSATSWRPAYSTSADARGAAGIDDERQFYVDRTGQRNPDRTAAYYGGRLPDTWTARTPQPPGLELDLNGDQSHTDLGPIEPAQQRSVTVVLAGLGDTGSQRALSSLALDDIGLSYPLAAHAELDRRGQPGHEKNLPLVWVVADLAAPSFTGYPGKVDPVELAAARQALRCGALADRLHSVRDPLTPARFWANLTGSISRTTLVVPADPIAAEHQFCR